MIINIASIPHSGSRLLVDQILKTPWQNHLERPKDGVNYFTHITTSNAPIHQLRLEKYPTIIPLRHPLLVASSWKQRGLDIGEMCVCWYILVEQLSKYNPYYLPVDSKDRNQYLDKINKGLKLDLFTAWPMINSKFNTTKPIDLGEDQEQVDRLIKNIDHFLKPIYPRKPRSGNKNRASNKSTTKVARRGIGNDAGHRRSSTG